MIHRVLEIPDPLLREIAAPVDAVSPHVERFVRDMFATMHANAGLGLAATQLGVRRRIVVIALPPEDDDPQSGIPYTLINPEITALGDREDMVEGCLSLPGFRAMIDRATTTTVEFLDIAGNEARLDAEGLLAQAIQHEVDHLDGVLFYDHLDSIAELEQIPPEPLNWSEDEEEEDDDLATARPRRVRAAS